MKTRATKTSTAVALCFALSTTAWATGIDTPLSTQDGLSYQQSLSVARQQMTEAQQQAYEWAVGNASVYQLAIKYHPELTPRKVIERETSEYIARKSGDIAELKAELAANASKLAQQEAAVREVKAELAKLTVHESGFQTVPDTARREELRFNFAVTNNSRFNVASLKWDAWLFLDAQEAAKAANASSNPMGRYCQISSDYKRNGGLAAGKTKTDFITVIGAVEQCPRWTSLQAQQAAYRVVKMVLDEGSVEDFDGNRVLPTILRGRADYERSIANAQEDLAVAQRMKAALNP